MLERRRDSKRAFLDQCLRANQAPFVTPSDQTINDTLTLMSWYDPDVGHTETITKEQVVEKEREVHFTMYDRCWTVINGASFDRLITTLDFNPQKAQLLSIRKLGSLLGMEIAFMDAQYNGYHVLPALPAIVADLFQLLDSIGISFEVLAGLEDGIFELIVSGANQLLSLADEQITLINLPELSYLQLYALTVPSRIGEPLPLATTREEAMAALENHAFRPD